MVVLHGILLWNLVGWGMVTGWMMAGNSRVSGVVSSWVGLWIHVLVGIESWSKIISCCWLTGVLRLILW